MLNHLFHFLDPLFISITISLILPDSYNSKKSSISPLYEKALEQNSNTNRIKLFINIIFPFLDLRANAVVVGRLHVVRNERSLTVPAP